jgi:hypothetical protein
MARLTSASTEQQVEIYVSGGPLGSTELSLHISTARTFVTEPKTLARLLELKAMTPVELTANQAAVTEAMLLPLSIDSAQTIKVTFSPELSAVLTAQFGADLPGEFSIHTRLVNNVLYLRLADYEVFGVQPEWLPEWIGIEVMAFLPDAVTSSVASNDFDVQDAQNGLEAPGSALATSIVYHVPPDQLAWYADFMQLTSLGVTELDGQAVQLYRLSWDIPRYLGGPLFAQQTGVADEGGYPNSTSRLIAIVSTILLDGLHAEVTQAVGVDDPYLHAVEIRVEWALGIAGGPLLAERPTIGFTSTTIHHALNTATSIPAPEGALVPPLTLALQIVKLFQQSIRHASNGG